MSTREIAYSIFETAFRRGVTGIYCPIPQNLYPPKKDDMAERRAAFERMKGVCRYIPALDEKKELAEYREEKYNQ